MANKTKLSSCGCGGGTIVATKIQTTKTIEKKRKRSPPASPKKTQLQLENQRRLVNRKKATKMAEEAMRQLRLKYPLQLDVMSTPKHKGLYFPPKQETERILNRQKVNQQVKKQKKEAQEKHKQATTKWKKSPGGTWVKNK